MKDRISFRSLLFVLLAAFMLVAVMPEAFSAQAEETNGKRPTVLLILDGFGLRDETQHNAIALADKESTMPPLMEFQTGYCQYKTYHDAAAGIWKVEMFWWQHDTMQTVYLTDEGITKMMVSVE